MHTQYVAEALSRGFSLQVLFIYNSMKPDNRYKFRVVGMTQLFIHEHNVRRCGHQLSEVAVHLDFVNKTFSNY